MEFHPAANLFPLLEGDEFAALVADLHDNGLQEEIKLLNGKILDGRNRWRACREAGVEPRFVTVNPADPVAYVWSLNGPRRHLTPAQLSMVGARMRAMYDDQAKKRQRASGGDRKSAEAKSVPANLPEPIKGDARDQVAKLVGVSGKTIDHATKVLNNAVPEVVKAVEEGRMAVSTAAILSTEPEDEQRREAASPKRRRNYKSVSLKVAPDEKQEGEGERPEPDGENKVKGVGVIRAREAVGSLTRIPKNDALRKRGFQIVTDWIRHNP